jgi:hypothetical protein
MSKFDPGNLLWFGAPPVPPEPKPYLLGWNPALSKFKPYGLPVKKLARSSMASSDFVELTKSMMDNVPPTIQTALIKYGVAVLPAKDVFDAVLWLNWDGPRGHDGRLSWKTISGLCLFDGHLLLICQNREDERGYIRNEKFQGLFNHELGHCLDRALDLVSSSPAFLACVAADIAKLTAIDKAIYQYLLQPDLAGPSEIFAECFACTQGLCCVESWTKDMPTYFSSSYQFVKELVGRLSVPTPQEHTNAV